jgi:hypothetical protein
VQAVPRAAVSATSEAKAEGPGIDEPPIDASTNLQSLHSRLALFDSMEHQVAAHASRLAAIPERSAEWERVQREHERRLREEKFILADPLLAEYSRFFRVRLSGLRTACSVICTGMVKNEEKATKAQWVACEPPPASAFFLF